MPLYIVIFTLSNFVLLLVNIYFIGKTNAHLDASRKNLQDAGILLGKVEQLNKFGQDLSK